MNELLSIIITTYDSGEGKRTPLLNNTVQLLHQNLKYPNVQWIIADDGSVNQEQHLANVKEFLFSSSQPFQITDSQHAGVGKSKNIALQKAFETSPFVLLLEDDWLLRNVIPLQAYMTILSEYSEVGMIRLGYLGGTMSAKYVAYNDVSFWDLDRGSGVYIYSGQVSLRHKRFYDICGYHPEGVSPGEEELVFCKHYNGVDNAPKILWPAEYGCTLNAPYSPFINIGMDVSTNQVAPGV